MLTPQAIQHHPFDPAHRTLVIDPDPGGLLDGIGQVCRRGPTQVLGIDGLGLLDRIGEHASTLQPLEEIALDLEG